MNAFLFICGGVILFCLILPSFIYLGMCLDNDEESAIGLLMFVLSIAISGLVTGLAWKVCM